MRRALLVLLALPASALADGTITADDTTLNIAQCTGTSETRVSLDDKMDLGLTWTVDPFTTQFAPGGVFKVFAANELPITDPASGTPCISPKTSSSTFKSAEVRNTSNEDIPASATSPVAMQTFSIAALTAAAGYGPACSSSNTGKVLYLCVQWVSGGNVKGSAVSSNVTLDLTRPAAAPTNLTVVPGDGTLHLTCSGNSDIASFKATVTLGTEAPKESNQASSCGDLVITGLTNEQDYTVVVYGMDSANNASNASDSKPGKPTKTDDFWDKYKRDGGQDSGGCSSTAGAAGILGALSLLAVRRRKP